MKELAFPLLGTAMVALIVVPLSTLAAKLLLARRSRSLEHLPRFGSSANYLLLVGPVLGPVVWFVSAGLHQAESGRGLAACLYDGIGSEACWDALAFSLFLLALVAGGFLRRIRQSFAVYSAHRRISGHSSYDERLQRLRCSHQGLRRYRVVPVRSAAEPVCTRGLLRPVIEVSEDVLDALDDTSLMSTLLHELEHARSLDPLRYFVADVCLQLNPLSSLLRSEVARWRLAREASCDEQAVRSGADPLCLAAAIVQASRPAPAPVAAAALAGSGNLKALRLRIGLLLGFHEQSAQPIRQDSPVIVGLCSVFFIGLLPHVMGSGPLDSLHLAIETTLAWLVLL